MYKAVEEERAGKLCVVSTETLAVWEQVSRKFLVPQKVEEQLATAGLQWYQHSLRDLNTLCT
jgi:hypothetical protein